MKLTEIKTAQVFRFRNEKSSRVTTLYIEPMPKGHGRLIITTGDRVFTRYFNGCNPDIFTFLSKQDLTAICSMMELQKPVLPGSHYYWELMKDNEPQDDDEPDLESPENAQYHFLLEHLTPIWSELRATLSMPFV